MNGINVSVNLVGIIEGPKKHNTLQVLETFASVTDKGKPCPTHKVTKMCKHSNRENKPATRKFQISEEILEYWNVTLSPNFKGNDKEWKKLGVVQKVNFWVNTFDEGNGVSWEAL